MIIECTPKELKELLQKETPVAATTSVKFDVNQHLNQCLANHDKQPKDAK